MGQSVIDTSPGCRLILVAEDSPTQQQHLVMLLEEAGFQVLAANDGRQAVELARERSPQLVISDVVMPGLDGYELCRALKRDPATTSIPIILVTELSRPEDVFKGLNCGADNFITKPYDERYLLARITYIFTNRLLRERGHLQVGVEIELQGERHFITADRQQILDLLISTYGEAVHLNGELRDRQAVLEATVNSLNAITHVTEALNRCTSDREVLGAALERAMSLASSPIGWCYIRMPDEERPRLEVAEIRGADAALAERIEQGEICDGRIWLSDEPPDHAVVALNCRPDEGRPHESHIAVPIQADHSLLGLLALDWPQDDTPDDGLLRLLTAIGQQAGIALERAYLHRDLERKVAKRTAALSEEIRQRKLAEAELERRRLEQAEVAAFGQEALRLADPAPLYLRAAGILERTLGADGACVVLRNDGGTWHIEAATGSDASRLGAVMAKPGDLAYCEHVRARGETVLVEDWRRETVVPMPESLAVEGTGSGAAIAIHEDAQVVGILVVTSHQPGRIGAAEAGFLGAIGTILSSARTRAAMLGRLRESEAEFRATFEQAAVGIVHTDLTGRWIRCNRRLREMLDYGEDELHTLGFSAVYHRDELQNILSGIRRLASGELDVLRQERRMIRKDGSEMWSHVTTSIKRDAEGNTEYYISVVEDISEKKKSEEQITHLQKLEAIGRLTGGIAHDFNNLLMIMLGNLELLEEMVTTVPEALDPLQVALGAAERGSELTRQLLMMSRRQPLEPRRVEVNTLVSEMARLLDRTVGADVQIALDLAKDLWPCHVDPGQLEAAIANLVVNARDAMPDGGTLTITTGNAQHQDGVDPLRPGLPTGDYVSVAVSDTGCGIPAEQLSLIFEPYFTTKAAGKGTGLGLSTVFGFVRQSGGDVSVYSEVGVGTTFRLFLPRDLGSETEAGGDEEQAETVGSRSGERVLLVEDMVEVRRVLARQLEQLGYECRQAADANAALALLATESFDALVTDHALGKGMSGAMLAGRCRAMHPDMAIVLVSGLPDLSISGDKPGLPVDRFLLKPVTRRKLAQALRAVLDGGAHAGQSSDCPG
ncbi:response regulator [Marinibaculum pumilum]|uniref:histidine kinase n=1 Tax=Marinibaculum pumilum TaxID=1766165 RepID=A0ABV7L0P2_9PROT